jgi:hypothetical protein
MFNVSLWKCLQSEKGKNAGELRVVLEFATSPEIEESIRHARHQEFLQQQAIDAAANAMYEAQGIAQAQAVAEAQAAAERAAMEAQSRFAAEQQAAAEAQAAAERAAMEAQSRFAAEQQAAAEAQAAAETPAELQHTTVENAHSSSSDDGDEDDDDEEITETLGRFMFTFGAAGYSSVHVGDLVRSHGPYHLNTIPTTCVTSTISRCEAT